jgi:hypothetical protein
VQKLGDEATADVASSETRKKPNQFNVLLRGVLEIKIDFMK